MSGDSPDEPFAGRALHFVGIGGAGMSGLALVAKQLGASVTGLRPGRVVVLRAAARRRHRAASIGHDAANLPEGAEVVVSTAIPEDNPELAAARAAGARVLHRADLLGELSRMKKTIAVSGTHGKTTTASMIALALLETGRDPAFLIGGELRAAGTNAAWGDGEWAVIEADESDRSFLKLRRDVAVVTNIELDHHATYGSLAELEEAFAEFAGRRRDTVDIRHRGSPRRRAWSSGRGHLPLQGGRHRGRASACPASTTSSNALAALAALRAAGVEPAEAAPALAEVHRRGQALRVARAHGERGRGLRRLRASPHRGARHARGGADARAAPAGGRVPAAPLLADADARARVRRVARARGPRSWCSTSTARASEPGGLPGRERLPGGGGGRGRRRRAAGLVDAGTSTTPSRSCAPS